MHNLHNPASLIGGKTIVGALTGGLIAVELLKRYIGLRHSTGDLYAIPLALGIAIGRIGCFLTGLPDNTYGTPARLPWAVDFGDGIPRHPTQLYEIAFLLLLIPLLYRALQEIYKPVILSGTASVRSGIPAEDKHCHFERVGAHATASRETCCFPALTHSSHHPSNFLPGDTFKLFMISYLSFRLLVDFLKPYPRLFLGLGGIQWACVLVLLYYSRDITRWLRPTRPIHAEA